MYIHRHKCDIRSKKHETDHLKLDGISKTNRQTWQHGENDEMIYKKFIGFITGIRAKQQVRHHDQKRIQSPLTVEWLKRS